MFIMAIVMSCSSATAIANLYKEDIITLPSGRKLYRHTTLPGSVLCFNDGVDRKVLILDAKYRIGMDDEHLMWGPQEQVTDLYPYGRDMISFEEWETRTDISDEDINAKSIDPNTSKYNTDTIITFDFDSTRYKPEAVQHCRKQIIGDNIACDLPNINTLIRIYVERTYIDKLDPTLEEYPNNSLEKIWTKNGAWSSTERNEKYAMDVVCMSNQIKIYAMSNYKTNSLCVVPVHELTDL